MTGYFISKKDNTMQELLLDPAIRDWVLLPITILMILIGIFRHELTLYLQSRSGTPQNVTATETPADDAKEKTAFIAET